MTTPQPSPTPMTPADWSRLKDWFGQAIDGTTQEAARVIGEAERESPELAARLRSLLEHHRSQNVVTGAAMAGLEEPVAAPVRERVGPYRILRELGRGGAGIVFLAERADDEFHRPVALKLLRYLVWDTNQQELLTRERRALASLRHENIASLIDWGATEDGIPWLVVEYVDGAPIDEYFGNAESRSAFQLAAALDLFEQICEAVQYAHRQLIVHGDLKPQNVLTTKNGVVKLLDFGISRLMNSDQITATAARRFTPAYASPEQIEGSPIGVATDVYGLGLLLYELLTGAPRFAGASIESILRSVSEARPAPPSEAAQLTATRKKTIRGDLDRIVMHALEKDPNRRYLSAEQMLADVRRYRKGYPIRARKAGAGYRAMKFVTRNRGVALAATLGVVALIGGAGVAAWKERQAQVARATAEARFLDLKNLAHSLIFDLHDQIRHIPRSGAVRRTLVSTGLQYLDRLSASGPADDALQMELAAGYYRMAYAQGGVIGANLGDAAGGRRSYTKALRILDAQWSRHPGDPVIGVLRYAVAFNLALSRNNPAEGIAMAVPYSAEADVLAARNPGAWSLHSAGLLHQTLGRIFRNAGDLGRSLAESDKALDDFRRLDAFSGPELHIAMARPEADRDEVLHMLGLTQISRSAALLDAGRLAESLAAIEDGRRREEECLALAPGSPPPMRSLTIVPGLRSVVLLEMGRRQEAIAEARRELRLTQEFLATDDSAVMTQRDVSQAKRHLGNALGDPGPLAQAAKEIGAIADGDPEFLLNRVLQAGTLNEYGFALAGKGRPADAAAAFRQALSRSEQVLAQAPGWVDALREKGMAEAGLGSGQCRGTWARVKEKSPLRSRPGDSRGACVGLSVMVPEGGGTNVFKGGRCSGTSQRLALWPDRDAAGVPERACLRFRC